MGAKMQDDESGGFLSNCSWTLMNVNQIQPIKQEKIDVSLTGQMYLKTQFYPVL